MPTVVYADLADQPLLVAVVVVAWSASGVAVAAVLARRGHAFRDLAGLGLALGPLLIGFALSSLQWKERHARPVVVREPRVHGGSERVLVAVLGDDTHVAESLAVLRSLSDRLHVVDVGVMVTFDDAEDELAQEEPGCIEALGTLHGAAAALEEFNPGLVLLPGRAADALARYVESEGADLVIIAGDDHVQSALRNDPKLRDITTVMGSSFSRA